jgi:hypothetical protein
MSSSVVSCVNLDHDYFTVRGVGLRSIANRTGIQKSLLKKIFRGVVEPTDEQYMSICLYITEVGDRYKKRLPVGSDSVVDII